MHAESRFRWGSIHIQCPAQLDGQIHSSNSNQIVKQIYYFDFNDAVHSVVWWYNGNKVRTTINANNWSYFSQRILLCVVGMVPVTQSIGILLIVESPTNEHKYNTSLYWCIIRDVSGQVETARHHHHVFNVFIFIVFVAVSNFHIIFAMYAAMRLAKNAYRTNLGWTIEFSKRRTFDKISTCYFEKIVGLSLWMKMVFCWQMRVIHRKDQILLHIYFILSKRLQGKFVLITFNLFELAANWEH